MGCVIAAMSFVTILAVTLGSEPCGPVRTLQMPTQPSAGNECQV